jgi:glutathione S-transferase
MCSDRLPVEQCNPVDATRGGSTKRDELLARAGTFQVPYLEDPNTGVKMFESAAMVEYLEGTYALSE